MGEIDMGIIGTHVASVTGTKASDRAAAEARDLWDALQERLGNLVDKIGGDNGFETLKTVQKLAGLVDQMENGGGLPVTAPVAATSAPVAALASGSTPTAPSPEEEAGKKLFAMAGDETEANKVLGLIAHLMKNRGLQQVVVGIVTNVSDPAHAENIVRDTRGRYALRSVNDLQLSYDHVETVALEVAELVNDYASPDVASALGDAKKVLAKSKTTTPVADDSDYIKRLAKKAGLAPSGTDFDVFVEDVLNGLMAKRDADIVVVLRDIGTELKVSYIPAFSSDTDRFKTEIVKAGKKLNSDLATAQADAQSAKDGAKKERDAIVKIADHNSVTYDEGSDMSSDIVARMIEQKGGYAQKLTLPRSRS